MCGIFWTECSKDMDRVSTLLKRRGQTFFTMKRFNDVFTMTSVLSIRSRVAQPIFSKKYKYLLQYNGELYNGRESDTVFISEAADRAADEAEKLSDGQETCPDYFFHNSPDSSNCIGPSKADACFVQSFYLELSRDEGEFAVSVLKGRKGYFFKDDVGRRSIGISYNPFSLSSVNYNEELDPLKLYIYDFEQKQLFSLFKPVRGLVQEYLSHFGTIQRILRGPFSDTYGYLVGYPNSEPRYWKDDVSLEEGVSMLQRAFSEAVRARLPEDDPVIFFSGGVDSLLVAVFTHLQAEPGRAIYLINTAIPGSHDRAAGIRAFETLKTRFEARKFILIKNDIDIEKINQHRDEITELIRPKTKPMDFNIGAILYFSAMCASKLGKTVLLGSGADEVFGGYNRYRNGPEFRCMMFFDLFTISAHNLGRDDRIIANFGVESRLPFLDSRVIQLSFFLGDSCFISDGEIKMNKIVIRNLLRSFGFGEESLLPKKAMQYGSGLAKVEKRIRN